MFQFGLVDWAHSSGHFCLAKCAKDSKFLLGFLLAIFSNDNLKDFFWVFHALPQSTQL